jgi:hypothetical protein
MPFLKLCCLAAAVVAATFLVAFPGRSQTNTAPKTAAAPKKSAAAPKATAKAPTRKPAAVPLRQARPTKDRYIEIQQALADAGYFEGSVNGVWNDASIAALRDFQTDQGLNPTGKVDSLSLIRLGLGPKYDDPAEAGAVSPG